MPNPPSEAEVLGFHEQLERVYAILDLRDKGTR